MNLHVGCYAGRKADERPTRFRLEGREYPVKAVPDQWYDPESIFYKVRAGDGNLYIPSTADIDPRRSMGFGFIPAEARGALIAFATLHEVKG
jgi:hypothetical protein